MNLKLYSIVEENQCYLAFKELIKHPANENNVMYAETKGDGYDLPNGCIWDALDFKSKNLAYVYWNPDGNAVSEDPEIAEVCYFIK